MSFGFDVGNFADAAHLAYVIYRDYYKVARGAPQEAQLLGAEVSTLSHSLNILQEEVQDPESSLVQAGDDRVKLVNDMVGNIKVTLTNLDKIARKHEIIGSTSASKGKRMWTRFKWACDWSTTEKFRGRLHQHNTMMSLLLTQVGNSSLQKIQSSINALESDINEIRKYMAGQQGDKVGNEDGTRIPFLSLERDEVLVTDDMSRSSLSASLLKHAETHQPWSTISLSQWIETGTWWLLRAQLEIRPITTPGSTITKSAYLALIKASWILIDIITCHPQLSFVSSTTRGHIAVLSTAIKQEFEKMKLDGLTVEILKSVNDEDLYIWEGAQGKLLYLKPQILSSAGSLETSWAVDGDERCFFLAVARCNFTASGLNVCIVMFLVQSDGRGFRLVARQQNGEVMLNIPFTKPVDCKIDGNQVTVDQQEIILDTQEKAQRLSSFIYTACVYLFQRRAIHFSVQAFVFWLSLVALKTYDKELVSTLHPGLASNSSPLSRLVDCEISHNNDHESRLYQVTVSLIRKFLDEDGFYGPPYEFPHAIDQGLLHWAIWIDNSVLVNLLMLEGLTITNTARDIPPLHIAALYGHDDLARTIVANSSKDAWTLARESDGGGRSTLHYAAYYGHEKVARSLLRWGADTNVVSDEDETPLHVAAGGGNANVVQLLLDNGARQDVLDLHGMPPLLRACASQRDSVIALFAKKNLDFTLRSHHGRNAWQVAIGSTSVCDHAVSQSTFELIMQSFWMGEKPQLHLPKPRLAIVSFEVVTKWAVLTVDSRFAIFKHPKPLPSHIKDLFGRCIKVKHVSDPFSPLTVEFHIIYGCETLDFSIAHSTLDAGGVNRLNIRGGGGFTSPIRGDGLKWIFAIRKDIATDPKAEELP